MEESSSESVIEEPSEEQTYMEFIKQELMSSYDKLRAGILRLHRNLSYQALIMGITFVGLLLFAASYITARAQAVDLGGLFVPLFISIFIGSSFGHYLGLAVTRDQAENQEQVISFAIGFLLALAVLTLQVSARTPLSMALVLSGITIILGHTSGLIDSHKQVRSLVDRFAGRLSPAGLGIVGIIKFGLPFLLSLKWPAPNLDAIFELPLFEMLAALFVIGLGGGVGLFLMFAIADLFTQSSS